MNICGYGCGKEAKHPPRKGMLKWCCSEYIAQCPAIKKINSVKNKGKKINNTTKQKQRKSIKQYTKLDSSINELCSYGCGLIAIYRAPSGKYCCNSFSTKCPSVRKKISDSQKGILKVDSINNCRYCGEVAKYWFKTKKIWCCSEYITQCPEIKKLNSKGNIGSNINESVKIKTLEKCRYCGEQAKYYIIKSKIYCCSKYIAQCKAHKKKTGLGCRLDIEKIKEKYRIFFKEEDLRYNPDKQIKEREIQVRCKNHKCENSKEKDGWFTPTKIQIGERLRQLESDRGVGGSYFYCSQECKDACPLFGQRVESLIKRDQEVAGIIKPNYYTTEEYQIWRQEIFKRAENKCEYCGNEAEHCHHIKPQKLEPFFSLDPDYGIACCEKCHYKYGHKDKCSTGQLASKVCL